MSLDERIKIRKNAERQARWERQEKKLQDLITGLQRLSGWYTHSTGRKKVRQMLTDFAKE